MASSAVDADFVIVYNARLVDKSGGEGCTQQYSRLLDRLSETGLDATGRPGAKGTGELLVFVKCPEKKLKAEVERERIVDWLHGVCSVRPDPRNRRDFSSDPITPAERLRLTFRLITGPREPSERAETPCAGIIPQHAPFDRVKSIFAPHDVKFNQNWISRWTSASHIRGIPREELNSIKDHLGESIAFYYEFLRFYFIALVFPAGIGIATWASKSEFNPLYAGLLVLWSIIFIEAWTLRERRLAVRWGTYRCSDTGSPRTDFRPDHVDDGRPAYTWYKREGRVLAAVPALLGFAAGLACLITVIYTTEVMINEVYDGPGKRYLSLLPTILFAGIVPQVVAIWQNIAFRLTRWENHAQTASFDKSLTLKLFSLNAVVSFGALTLTAFIYIPFGNFIVPHLQSFLRAHVASKHLSSQSNNSVSFNVNAQRLHNTLVALTTTTQVIGAFTEIGVPLITRYVFKSVAKVQERRSASPSAGPLDEPEERTYLERIRHEASLPEYNLFVDYAEMAVQFGYVTLWSVIWPLAPLMAFVNNFFELRSDAFKMTVNVRRPTPNRSETLGPWLHTLGFLTWLAALTNSSLIYLYRPHPSHDCLDPLATNPLIGVARTALNVTANALNATSLAPAKATLTPREAAYATSNVHLAISHSTDTTAGTLSALRGTMFSALLVALASEHAYVLARAAVRHVLERLLWRGTAEEKALRRSEESLKVQYMESSGLEIPKLPKTNSANAALRREVERSPGNASDAFWARPDAGLAEIQRLTKTD